MADKRKLKTKRGDPHSKYWRTKVLHEWSRQVRDLADNKCEICGRKAENAHHLLPKEIFHQFYGELKNGLSLCVRCHKWGPESFHSNPIAVIQELLRKESPQIKWAFSHCYDRPMAMKNVDYKSIYESLTASSTE